MDSQQRQRIIARHSDSLLRHGYSANALYWSNSEIQTLRFRVLSEIGIEEGASVLDVGCGFGDLAAYLQQRGLTVNYLGVDLSPHLIDKGREIHPGLDLRQGDLFDLDPPPRGYDYVLLSGALNEPLQDDGAYARRVIERMYETCSRGVAFNLLDRRNEWVARRFDLQSFNPDEIITFCQTLGARCQLRDDYLDNDFTVYLHRP